MKRKGKFETHRSSRFQLTFSEIARSWACLKSTFSAVLCEYRATVYCLTSALPYIISHELIIHTWVSIAIYVCKIHDLWLYWKRVCNAWDLRIHVISDRNLAMRSIICLLLVFSSHWYLHFVLSLQVYLLVGLNLNHSWITKFRDMGLLKFSTSVHRALIKCNLRAYVPSIS